MFRFLRDRSGRGSFATMSEALVDQDVSLGGIEQFMDDRLQILPGVWQVDAEPVVLHVV